MAIKRLLFFFVLNLAAYSAMAQRSRQTPIDKTEKNSQEIQQADVLNESHLIYWTTKLTDSGKYIIYFYSGGCKKYFTNAEFFPNEPVLAKPEKAADINPEERKPTFLTVHGNISYEFYYRSKEETAIDPDDLQQHTERVYLSLLLKEKYPLKVAFTARESNSPYFRNFFDPNIQFDRFSYNKNLKQTLISKLNAKIPGRPDVKAAEAELIEQKERYNKLKNRLESPSTLQKLIEERERNYLKKQNKAGHENKSGQQGADSLLSGPDRAKDSANKLMRSVTGRKNSVMLKEEYIADSISAVKGKISGKKDSLLGKAEVLKDSLENKYAGFYKNDKKKLDSLSKKIDSLQKRYDSLKNAAQKELLIARQKIYKATSQKELNKIAGENGLDSNSNGKLEKRLAAIRQFSIGRSILNYTELTAQNITVTGMNVEYNPSYYVAFAAGKIDYRFRDFFNKNEKQKGQYLVLGRLGIGDIEKKALIFTLYQGRKNESAFTFSDSIGNHVNLTGYSVEGIVKKDEHTSISAEFAKSTKPVAGSFQNSKETGTLWKMSDNSNMGINIKAQTIIPETNTRLNGFYRKTGPHFQSFSLFSYNTDQTAWLAAINQSFLKEKLSIDAVVRQNDFTDPFIEKTYKTTTIFKSFILNVQFPKYPTVRIGYYPGTQIYVIDKERIRENAYYIINGSASYSYRYKRTAMNSSFVYNRYINQATDSGFALYKGVNYYASQTLFLKKVQIQAGYSFTMQPELQYYTLEASADYSINGFFKIGYGLKYNKIRAGSEYIGERAMLSANLKRFGTFQFQYEKSFLPTYSHTLYPVETGRAGFYKYF